MAFALTPRRLETLAMLQRLCEQAGSSVHYSLVGARMRISAWTAYGLLRELEQMGLVARTYATRRGRPGGRSRILFRPSARAAAPPEETQGRLRAVFEHFASIADEAAAAREYLGGARADLAYQLGFWLSRLEAAGRHTADAARTVLEGGGSSAGKLQAVTAMGVGSALARLGGSAPAARLGAAGTSFSLALQRTGRDADARLAALVDAARSLPRHRAALQ
ncbi:MAG TPA: hypothetical protein VK131_09885 [Candidatus Acidoferrales bacterium]|nr:hypothetical protein [Candidatus Acidoferrales bacterium]